MKSMSLRTRILLPIITLIILGMVISTALSTNSTVNIIHTMVNHELETITQSLATQVSAWIIDLRADLKNQCSVRLIQDFTQQNDGDPVQTQQVNQYLKAFIERYSVYDSMTLINANGIVIAHPNPKVVGLDLSTREYFQQAMQGNGTISNVMKSKVSGEPVFVIVEPVVKNGQRIGVLTSAIELSKFAAEFIDPIKIGQKGFAYMADNSGAVLAHPDPAKILDDSLSDYAWGREIRSRKNGLMTYTADGVEKVVSFRTDPTTGWVIAAGASTDDMFRDVDDLVVHNAILGGAVVLVLIGVIILLVRPIVQVLNEGVNFARQIQAGDLSGRLRLERGDEIGQLGNALDNMADSLSERARLAEAIAEGDLTCEVTLASDKDVLGRALSNMTDHLNNILGQINGASEQIDAGSGQVSDTSQDLSQGATEQASAIEEIGASLNELSSRTQNNADNAVTASQLATTARNAAHDGSTHMQQMVKAMQEINESGQNISKIIKTIDEIAFQTNLLALNAAVEAARAGQQGKGFAVVAEEVRNLAARSAKAASETAELIEGSVKKGENGTEIANSTARALEEVVSGIGKTADLVHEIATSSREQAEGLAQINNGISQIDQVTQRNTAVAEESAAAAEELSSQSDHMRQLLMQFHLRAKQGVTVGQIPYEI
jgi:methyl-accepting chemotaxis protein